MVSIIIPIYNVEPYLEQCLKSVQNQTMRDIEIIAVNDGSIDSSLNILKKYAASDTRIIIIDKVNEGLALARESGLSIAKGEYVVYVDADDWIEPDMVETLYQAAIQNSLDLAICNFIFEFKNQSQQNLYSKDVIENYQNKYFLLHHVLSGDFPPFVWICIYKRSLLLENNIVFNSTMNGNEDFLYSTEVFSRTTKIHIIDRPLCHYRMRKSALTRKPDANFVEKQANLMFYVVNFLETNSLFTFESKKAFYQYFFRMWPGLIKKIMINNEISFLNKYKQIQWFLKHNFVRVVFEENYNLSLNMKQSIDQITIKWKLILLIMLFGSLRASKKTMSNTLFD